MRNATPNKTENIAFQQLYAERNTLLNRRKETEKMLELLDKTEVELLAEAKALRELPETDTLSYSPESGEFVIMAKFVPDLLKN